MEYLVETLQQCVGGQDGVLHTKMTALSFLLSEFLPFDSIFD